jgi:hypothetical protein
MKRKEWRDHEMGVWLGKRELEMIGEIKQSIRTEWEIECGGILSNSETLRRCIYETWKVRCAGHKSVQNNH